MVLCSENCGHGKEHWIFYKAEGNYIDDQVLTMPGGSNGQQKQAEDALKIMNS